METTTAKTGAFALKFGALLGLVNILFGLLLFSADLHYQGGVPVLVASISFMLIVTVLGISQFKKANGGYLSIAQGLKTGIGIALVGGIITMLYQLVLTKVLDPEMVNKQLEIAKAQLLENGATMEQADQQMEVARKFSGPMFQIAFGLLGSIFFGFVLSLIPTLIMKKTPSEY